ncbi:MAG: hypothetical protein M3252_07630 [Actinomycetota bacterium]|nr:hypothetical protein [Actinomycetota bacterium]
MRLAVVAVAVSLAVLAAVITNFSGDGSDLPLPAVIELSGLPPPDTPTAALAPPVVGPPLPPPPPPPVQETAKRPPTTGVAAEQGSTKQGMVHSRSSHDPGAAAPLPPADVEEVRRHVSFSSTDDYRYDCADADDPDDQDLDECDEDDSAAGSRAKPATDNDDDDEEAPE